MPAMPSGVTPAEQAPGGPRGRHERRRPPHRGVSAAAWMGLLAALLPIVAAVARALADGWIPEYDAAYFTARSLDVLTPHHPFLGAWSTLSAVMREPFQNLGPLQLLLMAPFTKVEPYGGAVVAVGLINAAAVVATWFAARRLFGTRGVLAVMAATVVLEVSFGGLALVDARQQLALLLPFWAFVWLTVALMLGNDAAVGPWIVAGSLVLQTHFSYSYLGLALVTAGLAGYAVRARGRWRDVAVRRNVAGGIALAALLWAHTIWDQVFGTGNLGAVLGNAGGSSPAGLEAGLRIAADSSLSPPFWWPGSVGGFDAPWSRHVDWSVLVIAVWLATLAAAAAIARRRRARRDQVMCGLAMALILVAVLTAAQIPVATVFGLALPQNYFWLWPISLFAALAIAAAVARRRPHPGRGSELVAAAVLVVVALSTPTGHAFPQWDLAVETSAAGDRPLLDQVRRGLDALGFEIDAPIVVDAVEQRIAVGDYYNLLVELTRAGIDFHFVEGSDDLFRFGADRCETGEERWRLEIVVGRARPQLSEWDVVLARLDGLAPDGRQELAELRARVIAAVRAGEVVVDGDVPAELRAGAERLLRAGDGTAVDATTLWPVAARLEAEGVLRVADGVHPDYRRWLELERAELSSHLLVYLTPNYFPAEEPCDGGAT